MSHALRHSESPDPARPLAVIFNHIPKCGGSTLSNIFRGQWGQEAVLRALYPSDFGRLARVGKGPLLLAGHCSWGLHRLLPRGFQAACVTLLRRPLDLRLSAYFYALVRGGLHPRRDPAAFFLEQPNTLVRWLGQGDPGLARRRLERRYFRFGLLERFEPFCQDLAQVLGLDLRTYANVNRNLRRREDSLDPALLERFLELNAEDCALYDWAADLLRGRGLPDQARGLRQDGERSVGQTSGSPDEAVRDEASLERVAAAFERNIAASPPDHPGQRMWHAAALSVFPHILAEERREALARGQLALFPLDAGGQAPASLAPDLLAARLRQIRFLRPLARRVTAPSSVLDHLAEAWLGLADLRLADGAMEAALRAARKAQALAPHSVLALRRVCQILRRLDRPHRTLALLERLGRARLSPPCRAWLALERCLALKAAGRPLGLAAAALARAIGRAPDPELLLQALPLLRRLGFARRAEALAAAQAGVLALPYYAAALDLALLEQGCLAPAEAGPALLALAARPCPDFTLARRISALLLAQGLLAPCADFAARELSGLSGCPRAALALALDLAQAQAGLGRDPGPALAAHVLPHLERLGRDQGLLQRLVVLLRRAGRADLAVDLLRRALAGLGPRDPGRAGLTRELCATLHQAGQRAEALEMLPRTVSPGPLPEIAAGRVAGMRLLPLAQALGPGRRLRLLLCGPLILADLFLDRLAEQGARAEVLAFNNLANPFAGRPALASWQALPDGRLGLDSPRLPDLLAFAARPCPLVLLMNALDLRAYAPALDLARAAGRAELLAFAPEQAADPAWTDALLSLSL